MDRPQTGNMQHMTNLRREDLLNFYNSGSVCHPFNQTNKEIQKKQFDFNIKNQRTNVTIQYDDIHQRQQPHHHPVQSQASHPSRVSMHTKNSKSINCTALTSGNNNQKKQLRQQSQSVPRHQPSASIVNTQAQPLINLHIQNAKLMTGIKGKTTKKTAGAEINRSTNQAGFQTAQNVHKSKSKTGRHNKANLSLGSKKNILKLSKNLLNHSNFNAFKPKQHQDVNGEVEPFVLSYDNKENQSMNKENVKYKKNNNLQFLDSDSSQSSPMRFNDNFQNYQLSSKSGNKSYFMDKSALLKHLSPDRSQKGQPLKQHQKQSNQPINQIISDRDRKSTIQEQPVYRSNGTTVSNLQPTIFQMQQDSTMNQQTLQNNLMKQNENTLNNKGVKINRAGTSTGTNKISLKGVDKLIKENLKKLKDLENEQTSKRFNFEMKQQMKKAELSQRNQEVRKINASKILHNHKHKNSQLNNAPIVQKVNYQKHRSKSCMNKTDNIFCGLTRSKERQIAQIIGIKQEQQLQINQQEFNIQTQNTKKEKKREKSFVLEIKELTKQIDDEIRRDMLAGKLDILTTSNKRTNLTTLNAKKEPIFKQELQNMCENESQKIMNLNQMNNKNDLSLYNPKKKKSKSRGPGGESQINQSNINNQNKDIKRKIKQFIANKKRKNQLNGIKSLEQTIENDKHQKLQENLRNICKSIKGHARQQSHNLNLKKPQLNKDQSNSDKQVSQAANILKTKKSQMANRSIHKKGNKSQNKERAPSNIDAHFMNKFDLDTRDVDISKEFQEEFNQMFKNDQKGNYQSISIEISPNKQKQSKSKVQKKKSIKNKQIKEYGSEEDDEFPDNQMTAIKNPALGALVKPNKEQTIQPPQSEIATLDKNMTKSNLSLIEPSTGQKKEQSNQRSPNIKNILERQRSLVHQYGLTVLKQLRINKLSEDKVLNHLHSAAFTIQQHVRKFLFRQGFYEETSDDVEIDNRRLQIVESPMYIDSEADEDFNSAKKQQTSKLIKNSSPLRGNNFQKQDNQNNQSSNPNKFYSADSSDVEKIVMCSVISSARPDGNISNIGGNDSLHNTQKYQPLRQKAKGGYGASQSSSLPNSGFNTAIKTSMDVQYVSRFEQPIQYQPDHDRRIPLQTTSTQNKFVPSLNLDKLSTNQNQQAVILDESKRENSNTQRSIFKRDGFQDYKMSHLPNSTHNSGAVAASQSLVDYPDLIKLQEEAIKIKENEQNLLTEMYRQKKVSPRTFEVRVQDIDKQVKREKEEVRKKKMKYEEETKKIIQMMNDNKKYQEQMKQMLFNDQPYQLHSRREFTDTMNSAKPLQSQRASTRRESTLLDMINNNSNSEKEIEQAVQQEVAFKKQQEEAAHSEKLKKEKEEEARIKREQEQAKKEKDEYERKQKEDKRIKDLQDQENKQKELNDKAEQERVQAQQKEKIQKQEEERQRKIKEEENKRIEKEQKEAEAKKKEQEIAEQAKKEELRLEKEKLKQVEKQKLEEMERQKKLQEEVRQRQKEVEALQKQQIEQERIKRENEENEKKKQQALIEEQNKQKLQAEQAEKERQRVEHEKQAKLKKQYDDEIKRKQEEEEIKTQKQRQEELLKASKELKRDNRYEIEDDYELTSEDIDFSNLPGSQQNINPKEALPTDQDVEENKGLSRTRSSQFLKNSQDPLSHPNTLNVLDKDEYEEDLYQYHNNDGSSPIDSEHRQRIMSGLNNDSESEDGPALPASQKGVDISKSNFFTQNFDEQNAEDVINQLHRSGDDQNKQLIKIDEGSANTSDDGGSLRLNEPIFNHNHRQDRKLQEHLPAEYQNGFPGAPVSPASMDSNSLKGGIQVGAMSLENTVSDGDQLHSLFQQVNKEVESSQPPPITPIEVSPREDIKDLKNKENKEQLVDTITDDVFRMLLSELQVDLDLLLLFVRPRGEPQPNPMLIFERRGIKTDLFAIERYVEEVLDEVMKEKQRFVQNIQTPLSKNPREVLNQLQNSEIGSYEHFEVTYPSVLPLDLYLKLEKRRKELRELEQRESQQQQNQDRNFLAECEHIHNKVLFDCINDSLLQFKPYGKDGQPLPWSRQNRRLKPIEDFTIEEMFEIVKHDLFRWAIMQAGTLPRREFVLGGVFDDELFAEIREKKLATLLAREMIENEPKWLNYEFEEAQVKIDIGDMILEQLVTETITVLNAKVQGLPGGFLATLLRQ